MALVAVGLAVAAVVLLFVRDLGALGIAVAAGAVALVAGWAAVTRTGGVRLVAVTIACLAAAAGAGLIVRRGAVDELALLVLALGLFVAARRRALPAPAAQPVAAPRVAVAENRGILILNPKSGGGKVGRFELVAEAQVRGIETIVLGPGDDLATLAEAAAARRPRALGMAGGDGSHALVADVASRHGVPYVCVAAGTRNHLALDLGLDLDDVVTGLDAFLAPIGRKRIDLAYANDRVFVNNTSIGFYADVVQSPEYRDAKLRTALAQAPARLGPHAARQAVSFVGPDGERRSGSEVLLVSNNPYELRRPLAAGARLRLDSGRLGIATLDHGILRQWTAGSFEARSDEPIAAAIDGEACVLADRVSFRIAPAALTVLLPPNADLDRGRRLQGPTRIVRTLARVAAGRDY